MFYTDNPSDNDNIFFAALEVHGGAAVVGEGLTLSPASGTSKVGESHTVTRQRPERERRTALGGRGGAVPRDLGTE